MKHLSCVSVVLPSLDPDEKLKTVVDGLLEVGFTDIILVNDGSKSENLHYFEELAAVHPEIQLLHHSANLGKGAALKTAFRWFLGNRPGQAGVVTVDGDNQHHREDIKACALKLLETDKLILGCRDFSQPDVPARSRFGNRCTCLLFWLFVGMRISDTQTGLRAIPRQALEVLLSLEGQRFEYETNMLLALRHNHIPYDEVKIQTIYIEENASSHFRVIRDSWKIYKLIFGHFFRYTLSSFVSSILDEGLFLLLNWLLSGVLSGILLTAIPTVIARIISCLVNFYINKTMVFRTTVPTRKALARYFTLAIPVLVAQLGLTHLLFVLLNIGAQQTLLRGILYALVMVVLFFISYIAQRRWVFTDKKRRNHA